MDGQNTSGPLSTGPAETVRTVRPPIVTLLALAVLSLAVVSLGSAYVGLARRDMLTALPLSLPAAAIIALNGVMGTGGVLLAFGLWFLRPWARIGMLTAVPLALLLRLALGGIFTRAAYERGGLWFEGAAAGAIIALIFFVLTRKHVRRAFDEQTGGRPHEA